MNYNERKIIFLLLVTGITTYSQNISSDFFPSQYIQIYNDFGVSWKNNSLFKPFQWDYLNLDSSSKCNIV